MADARRSTVPAVSTIRAHRWEIGAGLAAVGVAAALVGLAWTAARGLSESRELALDGRLLRLAHGVEAGLREAGPEGAAAVLESAREESREWVGALALESVEGGWAPDTDLTAAIPAREPDRRVELSLGRAWGGGPPSPGTPRGGGWRGARPPARRVLGVWLAAEARRPAAAERALVPAALAAGLALVGLSLAAGRSARRERARELEAVDRRRLEALGRAGAGLAHQLRNPLATVKGSCQLLLEEGGAAPSGRLRRVLGEVDRMDRLLGELLDYARPPAPEPAALELAPLLSELAAGREGVSVACSPGLVARVDPEHLREILLNLLDNARAVSDPGATIELAARRRPGGGRALELEVADRGPGPGPEPEAWFEPYATGRVDGTGLGLPIARSLATANGATLELAARPGGGAVARLRLVAAEEAG